MRLPVIFGAISLLGILASCTLAPQERLGKVEISIPPIASTRAFSPASLSLEVTGPEMDALQYQLTPGQTSYRIEVPAGADRNFTLTVSADDASDSFVLEKQASATIDIASGAETPLTLSLETTKTNYAIADPGNKRIVLLKEAPTSSSQTPSELGWRELDLVQLFANLGIGTSTLKLRDVEYAKNGELYFSVKDSSSASTPGGIWKLSGPSDTSLERVLSTSATIFPQDFVIDQNNNFLYCNASINYDYNEPNKLYKIDLSNPSAPPEELTLPALSATFYNYSGASKMTSAPAIDSQGMLYFIYTSDGQQFLTQYNPNTELALNTKNLSLTGSGFYEPVSNLLYGSADNLNAPAGDLLIIDGKLHFSGYSYAYTDGYYRYLGTLKTVQPSDFSILSSFGNPTSSGETGIGYLNGPRTFAAFYGRKQHLILSHFYQHSGPEMHELVAMDDELGTNMAIWGSSGTGEGNFNFNYFGC